MSLFRIEISTGHHANGASEHSALLRQLRDAGLSDLRRITPSRLFFVEGAVSRAEVERLTTSLLRDPVTERAQIAAAEAEISTPSGQLAFEIHLLPGVMDPVAASTLAELRSEGYRVDAIRTARRYCISGADNVETVEWIIRRTLANDCIEKVVIGTAGLLASPTPRSAQTEIRRVSISQASDVELETLSRKGHLFLNLLEMQAIQAHYRDLGREPTDLELETLAQTWSEHCVHKTLKSAMVYRGAPFPQAVNPGSDTAQTNATDSECEIRFRNLLRDTIARATDELIAAGRGPTCLSVFKDNAGIIALDDEFGIAFKVETHNRPSAIEPFGGAATGVGGCIRDVLGCGLGARPIANTDVFCVAPGDWPRDALPKGVLHPRRVLRGVVDGVGEYGNRMGIPTVNGAVHFDPRYLGNPLVFCGCVGLIPRHRIEKAARPGDLIVVVGGRTGRDGIHGATFSSAELTDTHADEFSHAVQIGNAIEEKRVLDAVLRARDHADGCLYSAITDCGAGGLSSAIGEMAEAVGARVDLEKAPLKYPGLRYDEIWISEAQERMVLAIPPARLDTFMGIMREEQVEATVIGTFGHTADVDETSAQLRVRFQGQTVGELEMRFLHHGIPMPERLAEWRRPVPVAAAPHGSKAIEPKRDIAAALLAALRQPSAASKEWIIRRYDHEVQGGSVIKPLMGRGGGPTDAAVLRPRPDSTRGIAVGCGLAPQLSDIDPYWMAIAAIDEAMCNVVSVGGDPSQTALLDNFCWGRTDDPEQLGALVRACQACYDAAMTFGTPFISGKDSLNNEFALDPTDVEAVIAELRRRFANPAGWGYPGTVLSADLLSVLERRIRETGRITIPPTLLISALAIVPDVRACVSPDLKAADSSLLLIGGMPIGQVDLQRAATVYATIHEGIRAHDLAAVHDASGGWLPALAEMAIGGDRGARIDDAGADAFEPCNAGFVVEVRAGHEAKIEKACQAAGVGIREIGRVATDAQPEFHIGGIAIPVASLRTAWSVFSASPEAHFRHPDPKSLKGQ